MRRLFPCCRLAVFPSIVKEASPLVFAEALASGVLPSGAYHSGLRDGLDDLRPCVSPAIWDRMKLEIEPERRVQSVIDNVCDLLDALADGKLSPQLRAIAEEHYDWRAVAKALTAAAEEFAAG